MSQRRALAPPRDLTIPDDGSKTAYDVLSRAIGRALNEATTIVQARSRGAIGGDTGALASAVRRPEIGVLVRALRGKKGADAQAIAAELVASVCFEHARAHALPRPIRIARLPKRILSSAARVAIDVPADARAMTFSAGRVVIDRASGATTIDLDTIATSAHPGVRVAYHQLDGEIVFATEDNNPLAMLEAHPDKEGNAVDLGGESVERWTSALKAALAIIATHAPALYAEMALYRPQMIPVGAYAERHLSASYQEAIGTIYLSLHPSVMTMVEAILHEFSHNKLNALFEVDGVIENAFSPLYSSPVRPDPRPLHGVLLAVHAFLPVARIYEKMIDARHPLADQTSFRARFAEIVRINREGASTILAHARPTSIGRGLVDEIARWDEYYRPFA